MSTGKEDAARRDAARGLLVLAAVAAGLLAVRLAVLFLSGGGGA